MAQPAEAAPLEPGPPHDVCKVALAREEAGDRTVSSRGPCHKAYLFGGATEDMRNEVASLMSPARVPTLDEVAIGSLLADAAIRRATDEPWGYLARCDIARRLGNADALEMCLAELRRVAPAHPLTKWMLTAAKERTPMTIWILRLFLLTALTVTVAHALRATWRARRRAPSTAAALLAVWTVMLGIGSVARATPTLNKDHLSSFAIDDANPEASVPPVEDQSRKPLEFGYFLQDLAAKAEHAAQKGDHAAAARYYGALTKAAPTVSYGPREMCLQLEAAGDLATAIRACRSTLARLGTNVGDFTRFVSLVLASKDPLPPEERKELDGVIDHLQHESQLGALPTTVRCEVDLRFKDFAALETCTAELAKMAPKDPKTISLQWALALHKHDRGQALNLIDRARGAGMSGEALARMERATRAMTLRKAGFMIAFFAAMLGAALALVRYRREISRRRLAV